MAFPTNPQNGQTTTVNGINYIYSTTNNAWKRQALTNLAVTNLTLTGNATVGALVLPDGGSITTGYVYDLDPEYPDGFTNVFPLTYNNNPVTVTNPWSLDVMINGVQQPAFTENYNAVWLSTTLCAFTGYTISSGNLKFADCPPAGTRVIARLQPGSAAAQTKVYPFNPVDIMLGH